MSMMNTGDILETIEMFTQDNLDVRTVTMGISLLDCIDPDPRKACEKIYNKITTRAARLVPAVEHISAEYGIPIINKRISVTPIAMLLGACPDADPVDFAKTLDAAGKKVGVNFVGGYTALVHKGFSAGDLRLIESPRTGRDGHRLQLGEHRCHQGGPEHGRHQADGRGRQEGQRAYRRPSVHRRSKAGGLLQRTRGQSLYGGCLPRPR
jgi:hypothetical protein